MSALQAKQGIGGFTGTECLDRTVMRQNVGPFLGHVHWRGGTSSQGVPERSTGPRKDTDRGLIRTSRQQGRTRSGAPTSPTCGPAKAGCISPSSSTCSQDGWLAGQQAIGCIATWLLPPCAKL